MIRRFSSPFGHRSAAVSAAGFLALATLASSAFTAPSSLAPKPAQVAVQPSVRAFFTTHCLECHDDTAQKGGVRLDNLPSDLSDPAAMRSWTDVHDVIATGQMPPKKKAQPPQADRAKVVSALSAQLTAADLARRQANGRVVLRRLNRTEYENTIRDLLDIKVDVKDLLPEDGAALGFDNVADALSVSSVLMERYLEAADVALDAAIETGPRPTPKHWDVPMTPVSQNPEKDYRLKGGVKELPSGAFVFFNSNGETPIVCDHFKVKDEGTYKVRVTAYAHQSDGPLTMCVIASAFDPRAPRKVVEGYFEVPPDEKNPRTIEFTEQFANRGTIKILAYGTGKKNVRDTSDYKGPGVAVVKVEADGPLAEQWPPRSHAKLFGDLNFKEASLDDAERVLTAFAARAFRRPVTNAELAPYVQLMNARFAAEVAAAPPVEPRQKNKPVYNDPTYKTPFEQAIRTGLKAILCAPEFLFLHERPGMLDDFAVASRLSYFLWSSTPDDELLKLAGNHTLRKPDVLRQQTDRLLNDSRAGSFTDNFTGQWLGLRQIDNTTPDKQLYPEFDAYLQWSMLEETRRFFDELLGKDLSLLNFVRSDFTFLNARLAEHYGLKGLVKTTEPQLVKVPADSHRGGVLTQAAVLKVTANGTTTSPVVRGAWVMRNILGQPPKPPPPNVPAVEPDIRGATTVREQLSKHRELGACASCHARIDPPGNALESFDVIGGWRENYRAVGADIRSPSPNIFVAEQRVRYKYGPAVDPHDALADGRAFANVEEFKKLLLAQPDPLARCLAEKLMVYSTGGGLDFADRPAVDAVIAKAKSRNYGLRTLVHEVVQSPVFLNK